jgi:hypothetical protein
VRRTTPFEGRILGSEAVGGSQRHCRRKGSGFRIDLFLLTDRDRINLSHSAVFFLPLCRKFLSDVGFLNSCVNDPTSLKSADEYQPFKTFKPFNRVAPFKPFNRCTGLDTAEPF